VIRREPSKTGDLSQETTAEGNLQWFEALLAVPVKSASMDLDRKSAWQILVAASAVLLFIGGLAVVSTAYGTEAPVENERIDGDLSGELVAGNVTDGETATFEGHISDDFEADITGNVSGSLTDGSFVGQFNGTISGAVDGTVTGELNGTIDDGSFDGTFNGTANGTSENTLTPDGGLVLLGLIALFIILLPVLGYFVEQQEFDEDEDDE
jgi:hypothetical protein